MTADCPHCPGAISPYNLNEDEATIAGGRELFHQPCKACPPFSTQEQGLCSTCQHLRLRHLVSCVPLPNRRKFLFHLYPDRKENATVDCPCCRLIQHMVSQAFGENPLSDLMPEDWSLSLFLSSEYSKSYNTVADIYLQFKDGDEGMSNMWIGDIHVADVGKIQTDISSVGEQINWPRLRAAINKCTTDHIGCKSDGNANLPQGFRLVDVARRCIVETSDVDFVALSYVWGKDTRASLLTATRKTIEAYKKEGGLVASDMPQTIEDAMNACTKLGTNYLWADRLCIIQDDPEDKMHQIMAMNDIYESASLVLVSAYGDSMDFGIDGVSRSRSVTQHHIDVSGLRLTNLVRESAEDPLSLWQTRGWTYQEAVCAKRLLHFTNTRAYYECQTSTYYEDMYNPEAEIDEFTTYGVRLDGEDLVFDAFERHLANYSSRKLSFPSDVYNAFIGIANLLYGPNYNQLFFYGLPKIDFDRALRWHAWNGVNSIQRAESSTLTCPSWSWASAMIQGEQVRYQDMAFYGTLTLWTAKTSDPERWEVLNLQAGTKVDENWETNMTIAIGAGCFRISPIEKLLRSSDRITVHERFCARWSNYDSFCRESIPNPGEPRLQDPATGIMGLGYIHTIAQAAFFRLGQRKASQYGVGILDANDQIIGELCGGLTKFQEEALNPENKSHEHEFVAISLSGFHIRPYTGEERTTKNYVDKEGANLDAIPIVNVLLIERKNDLAYRKELGWVYMRDWAVAARCWRSVVLG
ncbi:unnamed protein product [Periconia digitata]|uniref:Heterokaryon incompatibility domain-containing protein n=1 Tax=Periconia digitata TaxID=1303443 RepID=A0A9W4XLV3_9PLEO|nr:unnamed protein product [Periconia digitata]